MKKIYSLMLALLATLCVGTAYAGDPITIYLEVEDSKAVTVFFNSDYDDPISLVDGKNSITVQPFDDDYWNFVHIMANDGYSIKSITPSDENATTFVYSWFDSMWELDPAADCEGVTYTIQTSSMAELRTDSVLVRIDDPLKASLSYAMGETSLELTANEWTVIKFAPDNENDLPLVIYPLETLYKVLHNQNEVVAWRNSYQITPADGDSIDIICNAPADLTLPVIFKWAEGAVKEALDSVWVEGAKVEYKDTLNVHWSKGISLYFNVDEYLVKVNNIRLKNSEDSYSVTDTLVLEISTELYKDINFTIIAHNPSCFTVEKSLDREYFTLEEGSNDVKVTTKDNTIYISKAADCVLDSVCVNGKRDYNPSAVQCNEGDIIEIWAQPIIRDLTFMLYVDSVKGYNNYTVRTILNHYLAYSYSSPLLTSGYNVCKFGAVDNPINMKFVKNPSGKPVYYLNDAVLTAENFDWQNQLKLTLADGDVVKVFADTADVFEVNMYVADEVVVSDITKDRIVPIVDWTNPVSVLQNTEISFKTDAEVKVNDEVIASEDGVFTLVIEKNTIILVGGAEPTGMENVVISNKAEKFVRDGQLIIRMNGVEYNVLGAKLQ